MISRSRFGAFVCEGGKNPLLLPMGVFLEEWGAVMRYFLLKQHAAFTHAPCLINWFNVFDARKLRPETAREIPYRSLIAVKPDAMLCFTDVVLSPYLLLSASLKKVVAAYEPGVQYKDVVLLDKEHEQYELYYLPILEEVDCLHETSECTLDRSRIKRAVFAREKLSARSIFRVGGLKDAHIAVRLDLAESFLRRKAAGMALTEVEVV